MPNSEVSLHWTFIWELEILVLLQINPLDNDFTSFAICYFNLILPVVLDLLLLLLLRLLSKILCWETSNIAMILLVGHFSYTQCQDYTKSSGSQTIWHHLYFLWMASPLRRAMVIFRAMVTEAHHCTDQINMMLKFWNLAAYFREKNQMISVSAFWFVPWNSKTTYDRIGQDYWKQAAAVKCKLAYAFLIVFKWSEKWNTRC